MPLEGRQWQAAFRAANAAFSRVCSVKEGPACHSATVSGVPGVLADEGR